MRDQPTRRTVLQQILVVAALLFTSRDFAQDYVCDQGQECLSTGIDGPRSEMNDLVWRGELNSPRIYSDYGNTPSHSSTEASDRCLGCENVRIEFHHTSWFPTPDPNDGNRLNDPRKTSAGRIESALDLEMEKAVARIDCPTPGGRMLSTMNLYTLDDTSRSVKLIGAGHSLVKDSTMMPLIKQGYDVQRLMAFLGDIVADCKLEVTDRKGIKVLETLKIQNYQIGSFLPESDRKHDILLIELKAPSKLLKAVKLKETSTAALVDSKANMIAYHNDVAYEEVDAKGKKITYNPRTKSVGTFKSMKRNNFYARVPGVVPHSVSCNAMSSGALLYDSNGDGVAIHVVGSNPDNGAYDGVDRYNLAVVLDNETINFIKKF